MSIQTLVLSSGKAEGSNGVATSNASKKIIGKILAIGLLYLDSPPGATTDVVISEPVQAENHPVQTFLTRTDTATDGWFYPRRVYDDNVGAAITGEETEFVVSHEINVKINQANANDEVVATIVVEI